MFQSSAYPDSGLLAQSRTSVIIRLGELRALCIDGNILNGHTGVLERRVHLHILFVIHLDVNGDAKSKLRDTKLRNGQGRENAASCHVVVPNCELDLRLTLEVKG